MRSRKTFDIQEELLDDWVGKRVLHGLEPASQHFLGKVMRISVQMLLDQFQTVFDVFQHHEVDQSRTNGLALDWFQRLESNLPFQRFDFLQSEGLKSVYCLTHYMGLL